MPYCLQVHWRRKWKGWGQGSCTSSPSSGWLLSESSDKDHSGHLSLLVFSLRVHEMSLGRWTMVDGDPLIKCLMYWGSTKLFYLELEFWLCISCASTLGCPLFSFQTPWSVPSVECIKSDWTPHGTSSNDWVSSGFCYSSGKSEVFYFTCTFYWVWAFEAYASSSENIKNFKNYHLDKATKAHFITPNYQIHGFKWKP